MGMIFDETYRPFFEKAHQEGLYDARCGLVNVSLDAVATRTGKRAEKYKTEAGDKISPFRSFTGNAPTADMLATDVDFVCVATPDDRHFSAAKEVLTAGKHLLVEKPSVLTLQEVYEFLLFSRPYNCLATFSYHKLLAQRH